MSSKELTLKPKDILFEEGDQSQNLYFLKKGSIRIFKKKAEGTIEIDTIRAGQILGELAFFDGQPRSATAEALTTCEIIEMSKTSLEEAMSKFPDWLVSLTKTISTRLRASNNRIRILESLTTEYGVDRHGNRSKEYVYINTPELLRFNTAILTVASRYGKNATTEGIQFSSGLLEKFATQILQVPSSKVASLIELFKTIEILKGDLFLTDIRFLDQLIQFLNDQNLLAPEKQQTLSEIGFKVLTLITQNSAQAVANKDGSMSLNIAPALKAANLPINHLQELQDQGFLLRINLSSGDEVFVDYDGTKNVFLYRTFLLITSIDRLNEEKRKA